MQIILDIDESNSEKVLKLLKEMGKDLISNLEVRKKRLDTSFQGNKTFQEEKIILTKILKEVETGKATLLSHDEVWAKIQDKKAML